MSSDLRRRWLASHIVGQYGRRYDGNLTIGNAVFIVHVHSEIRGVSRGCTSFVERRILTRASFHPTYGGNSHPASGKGVIRSTPSMVCVSHRRSAWTEVRRESDNWKRSFHRADAGVSATDFREGHGTSRGCMSSVERRILTRASLHPTYGEILLKPAIRHKKHIVTL